MPNDRGNRKSTFLKVILLGEGGVGKSSLMNRFVSNNFNSTSYHTIGVEFLNKDLVVDGCSYTLQIWDTAGQERFKSLRTPFYRGSDVCLLTFALNDKNSFNNLELWKKEFLSHADVECSEKFPFILLGNKCDLERDNSISEQEIMKWCQENNSVLYFPTSAKNAVNVTTAFTAAVRCYNKMENTLANHNSTEKMDITKLKKNSRDSPCCK